MKNKGTFFKIGFITFIFGISFISVFPTSNMAFAQIFRMDTKPFREGSVLNGKLTNNLLDTIKANLKSKGLPFNWIEELRKTPPRITFLSKKRMGDNSAQYQPTWQGPLGNGLEGDTVYLLEGTNILNLSSSQIATITHELWHAWFDFIPTYPLDDASGFSDAQEEAIGGFIDELADGKSLKDAVSRAITEAEGRNGTAKQAIEAIMELEKTWNGSFFGSGLSPNNASAWLILRRLYPAIADLEPLLPKSSQELIRQKEKLNAQRAQRNREEEKNSTSQTNENKDESEQPLNSEENQQASLPPINIFCELNLETYKKEQKTLLEENWNPPKPPHKGKWLTLLSYRLKQDLTITNIELVKSSGYQLLDQSAINHINSLQGEIRPFPECYPRKFLDVDHEFKLLFF